MSEEPKNFPEPVPTNHGHFEGPATYDDYLKAHKILDDQEKQSAHVAQLIFQERKASEALSDKEADIYDDVTKLLKREVFRREADYKLDQLRFGMEEKRFNRPNNAIIGSFDGKGLKETNDTKGHAEGDRMLFNIGQIISSVGHEDDLLGRSGAGSDEFGGVYFFRDNIITQKDMISRLNERILYLVKYAVSNDDIAGLKWKLVPYQPGRKIDELLHLADPLPGSEGLMEWPPEHILKSRS